MAPAHIPVFLSQKPSTENGINRPAVLFSAWSEREYAYTHREDLRAVFGVDGVVDWAPPRVTVAVQYART